MRGWSHDRLARTTWGSRSDLTGCPALVASGHLLAALALLVLAPPAILGWIVGAWVVRGGWVSRGRLAAAASVTGALAKLVIAPRWPLAGPPEAQRPIRAGPRRLAAVARSHPITTTRSRVARCHRWGPIWVVSMTVVLVGCVVLGCAGVPPPARAKSGLVDAAN